MNNKNTPNNNQLKTLFDKDFSKFCFSFEDKNTVVFEEENLIEVMTLFHENDLLQFEILIDIIAVDYSDFGISEWNAKNANNQGYSR